MVGERAGWSGDTQSPAVEKKKSSLYTVGWVSTVVLGAGAIVTGIIAGTEAGKLSDARNAFPGNKSDIDSKASTTTALSVTTDVLGIAAIIVGGVTLYFTLTRPKSAAQSATAPSTSILDAPVFTSVVVPANSFSAAPSDLLSESNMHGKRRIFWFLTTSLLLGTAACTLLLDRDKTQCSTDGDCAHFAAGAVCEDSVCVAKVGRVGSPDASGTQDHAVADSRPATRQHSRQRERSVRRPDARTRCAGRGRQLRRIPGCFKGTPILEHATT